MRRVVLLFAGLLFSGFSSANDVPVNDEVWVIVRPVQCLGNPWEKEWLKRHPNQDAKYPRQNEIALIKAYFAKKRIPILQIRQKPYAGQGVCQSCDCSRGDVLYFLIHGTYVGRMVDLGYTERLAAADLPTKHN